MPSTRDGSNVNEDWLLAGSPSGVRSANLGPYDINADLTCLTTQVMTSVAVALQSGLLISNISFKSGATAADTPTNCFFALYDTSGALLAQSADQTTTAWAANTVRTLALATAQRISTAGVYYVGCMVKATTPPTLVGHNSAIAGGNASILSSKVLAQTSGSSLTATAPATIATPTTIAGVPLAVLT